MITAKLGVASLQVAVMIITSAKIPVNVKHAQCQTLK